MTDVAESNEKLVERIESLEAELASRRETEAALQEELDQYRLAFLNSVDGILLTDPEGRCFAANPAICRMLQRTEEELRQFGRAVVVDPNDTRFPVVLEERTRTGKCQGEVTYRRKDGTPLPVEISSVLFRDQGGRDWALVIARDISDRKRMEERLLRAQRLEAAGRIASQVAHDFNNLLGPLVAYPELIKMKLRPDHPAAPYCDAMLEAAQQMADINSDMLALSRRGLLEQQFVNLNQLVRRALTHLGSTPTTLTIDPQLEANLLSVSGSSAQLLRMISNLLSNAREAMQDVGLLTVKTENVYVDLPTGRYNRIEAGEYVLLQVVDTGCGIPADIRDRVFDVFFTTKGAAARRGSGLGLSVVQAIVEDHGGYIDLESEVGKGTSFSIYLPARRQPLRTQIQQVRPGTETVLVVDDDWSQRQLLRQLLESLGYQVQAVAGGTEAVAYLRERPADLLVLDMVMPGGIDGAETYRRASEVRPGQRAILLSGASEPALVERARALGAGACLRKPVSLEELGQAVRAELERCSST